MKISTALIVLSLLLIIVGMKAPLPQNGSSYKIVEYKEIEDFLNYLVLPKKEPLKTYVDLPFKGKDELVNKGVKNGKEQKELVLSSIFPSVSLIYCGKEKYAIVEGKIVKEGERIGFWIVKRIYPNKVLLKNLKGEERWVNLPLLP